MFLAIELFDYFNRLNGLLSDTVCILKDFQLC
jgi:hypothetical protein